TRLPPDVAERAAFLAPLCAPFACAPVMMPAHVDDWVQTSVAPEPDPDPALFLHGPQSGPADVSVVWRADVSRELLQSEVGNPDATVAHRIVALVPPTSMEALSLPIWHVRNWLRDRAKANADFTDLEGEREPEPDRRSEDAKSDPLPFLIWKGPERADRTKPDDRRKVRDRTRASDDPDDIRPGNTIVVPASYGGCDAFGWNPDHTAEVCDVADDCSWRAKRRPVLRVHPKSGVHLRSFAVWQRFRDPFPAAVIDQLPSLLAADPDTGEIDWDEVARGFREVRGDFDWLRTARRVEYPSGVGLVLIGRKRTPHPDDVNTDDSDDETPADDEGNSFIGTEGWVWLEDHCRNVQARAEAFTRALALSDDLSELVSRAALLHDAGKADRRFQDWLYGSEAEAARNEFRLIAKSRTDAPNASAIEAARKRAGWPKGGRHEAASVLLARSSTDAFAGLNDPELCEYLIGSHHGRGRPLWPFTASDEPLDAPGTVPVELDGFALRSDLPMRPESALSPLHAGWVDLFWRLVRRYGYWGLAYLETLLVLADHQQSEAEREGQP
ncbi:MAG: CRISPR-associated endonuclease Cas3'', partial [Gemmataceae bacterium]|nr:CRISPR-associated endonuclease Cas3'' [Gemmataceae bacterium]